MAVDQLRQRPHRPRRHRSAVPPRSPTRTLPRGVWTPGPLPCHDRATNPAMPALRPRHRIRLSVARPVTKVATDPSPPLSDDAVAVSPAPQAAPWPLGQQAAQQRAAQRQRGLTLESGAGDSYPELDGTNDRVGNEVDRSGRRRHRSAPRKWVDLGGGTCIIDRRARLPTVTQPSTTGPSTRPPALPFRSKALHRAHWFTGVRRVRVAARARSGYHTEKSRYSFGK